MDVLCAIFEVLRGADRSDSRQSKFESSLHWIPEATHICRSWRDAALSARYLWTNINVTASIPWALEFARRSGNAPICMLVQPSSDPRHPKLYECTKTLLHENMQRIRNITFHGLANCEETLIMSALSDDAHSETRTVGPAFYAILQDLRISFNSTSPFLLTNNVIRAPELQKLSLTYCSFGVEFGSLRNLSHLSISETASPIISPHCLHRVLSQTPNLEKLVLGQNVQPITVDSHRFQPVILPKLLQIEIRGNAEWTYAILQLISYGPQRKMIVQSYQFDYHSERILSLFTSIVSHARESSIYRLQLSFLPSPGALSLRAGQRSASQPNIQFAVTIPPQLGLPIIHLFDGLLRRINYQDIRILQLESVEKFSTRLWVEHFGSLPWLTVMDICGNERELFGALIDETGNIPVLTNTGLLSAGGNRPAFPFQSLHVIQVSERKELYAEEDLEFMLNCLQKRLDLDMGIKSLSFYWCGEPLKSQVTAFNGVVELTWTSRPVTP